MYQKGSVLLIVLLFLAVLVIGGIWYLPNSGLIPEIHDMPNNVGTSNQEDKSIDTTVTQDISVVAENLDTPWSIVLLPSGEMLISERKGTVQKVSKDGSATFLATIANAKESGEGGLLGIEISPNFSSDNYVYLYYTYAERNSNTLNRVVRMTYTNGSLSDEKIIIDAIPGASNHNGGRIKFGPDRYLYIGTGDAQEPSTAQNTKSLAGKILRVKDDGSIPSDNPFGNAVYSYGHRNVQGLSWDSAGQLWATEHGRSGLQSGLDEVNRIEIGKNYGWPVIQGDETRDNMETAFVHSGNSTWAPGGITYFGGNLYFVGLRGNALYQLDPETKMINEQLTEYGRLRDVVSTSDDSLYVATSNKDGRGVPKSNDDKVFHVRFD